MHVVFAWGIPCIRGVRGACHVMHLYVLGGCYAHGCDVAIVMRKPVKFMFGFYQFLHREMCENKIECSTQCACFCGISEMVLKATAN